jgi:murein L,D-transpeptidase YafK
VSKTRSIVPACLGLLLFALAPSAGFAGEQLAVLSAPKADRVIVLKTERKLVVLQGDRILRVFRVALGRYSQGPKRRQGDARTPEGEYTLDYKLEDSAFYRAIHISYPNEHDLRDARARGVDPGGRIMIHGLPNRMSADHVGHPRIDWTQGCIAVTNREMDILWSMIEPGTPIEIHP